MADVKCPATLTLQRKLTSALQTCVACAPQVEYLEQLARACPEIAEQVQSLRLLLDHIENLSRIGLAMKDQLPPEEMVA